MPIKFIDSPTERTTAITDLILAILALGCSLYLLSLRSYDPWKAELWAWAFGLLALSAMLGAIAHGFQMSQTTNRLFWHPLNFTLGLTVALFVTGVIYDGWGLTAARDILPLLIGVSLIFFAITLHPASKFLFFVIYETAGLLFAMSAYVWLLVSSQLSGTFWMVVGILVTLIAAGIQTKKSLCLTLGWQFDHNSLYHLIQMVGLLLLLVGLRVGLLSV